MKRQSSTTGGSANDDDSMKELFYSVQKVGPTIVMHLIYMVVNPLGDSFKRSHKQRTIKNS